MEAEAEAEFGSYAGGQHLSEQEINDIFPAEDIYTNNKTDAEIEYDQEYDANGAVGRPPLGYVHSARRLAQLIAQTRPENQVLHGGPWWSSAVEEASASVQPLQPGETPADRLAAIRRQRITPYTRASIEGYYAGLDAPDVDVITHKPTPALEKRRMLDRDPTSPTVYWYRCIAALQEMGDRVPPVGPLDPDVVTAFANQLYAAIPPNFGNAITDALARSERGQEDIASGLVPSEAFQRDYILDAYEATIRLIRSGATYESASAFFSAALTFAANQIEQRQSEQHEQQQAAEPTAAAAAAAAARRIREVVPVTGRVTRSQTQAGAAARGPPTPGQPTSRPPTARKVRRFTNVTEKQKAIAKADAIKARAKKKEEAEKKARAKEAKELRKAQRLRDKHTDAAAAAEGQRAAEQSIQNDLLAPEFIAPFVLPPDTQPVNKRVMTVSESGTQEAIAAGFRIVDEDELEEGERVTIPTYLSLNDLQVLKQAREAEGRAATSSPRPGETREARDYRLGREIAEHLAHQGLNPDTVGEKPLIGPTEESSSPMESLLREHGAPTTSPTGPTVFYTLPAEGQETPHGVVGPPGSPEPERHAGPGRPPLDVDPLNPAVADDYIETLVVNTDKSNDMRLRTEQTDPAATSEINSRVERPFRNVQEDSSATAIVAEVSRQKREDALHRNLTALLKSLKRAEEERQKDEEGDLTNRQLARIENAIALAMKTVILSTAKAIRRTRQITFSDEPQPIELNQEQADAVGDILTSVGYGFAADLERNIGSRAFANALERGLG